MIMIATEQRLSQSLIWEIQRQYFLQNGMKAWQDDIVPHQISSSPIMARAYSQIILGYLRDCAAAAQRGDFAFDETQPLYIIELGAGSGRLAYHILQQLHGRLPHTPFANLPVNYIMTDFVPEILDFWRDHPQLQEWVEAGLLDFALFDATDQRPLTLQHAQRPLAPAQIINPPILIANYFFDSIPQDSFLLRDGRLHENLLSIHSAQPEPNLADPAIWERLELRYDPFPLKRPYYDQPLYNAILAAYETHLPDTSLSFPNLGLDCLRFWQKAANGRLLLLTSDRGHTLPDSLVGQEAPLPNLHGSFSLMVNYHAIAQYAQLGGGMALYPAHYQDNLQTLACLLGQLPQNGRETTLAFSDAVVEGSPDDFFALKKALESCYNNLTLSQLLSLLRLNSGDADLFRDCFPMLLERLKMADSVWYADVYAVISQIWEQYLPLAADDDLEEMMTQLLEEMGYLE